MKYAPTKRTHTLLALEGVAGVRKPLLELFEQDVALIGPGTTAELDRVQFPAVKIALSGERGMALAAHFWKWDVRDLLMNADFGTDVTAHEDWYRDMMTGAHDP